MKVSTELKRLITLRFEELKSERNEKLKEEAKSIFEGRVAEIEASSEWNDYVAASERLYKYLEPDYKAVGTLYGNGRKEGSAYYYESLIKLKCPTVVDWLNNSRQRYINYHSDMSDLNTQRDKLLVKLTYEKNLEKIEEMLAEFGIKL